MHNATCAVRCLGLIVALAAAATAAHATDFDFAGNFEFDNDVALVGFTAGAPSNVTVFTSSWIAGEPPPGADPYGFDPVVSVWGSDGGLVASWDDVGMGMGGTAWSNGVSYDYGDWDAYFDVLLAAGEYSVTVTQSNNYPVRPTLSDGFTYDGDEWENQHFTSAWGDQESFNGGWLPLPDPRSSRWELHVLNVAPAETVPPTETVPEPSTWLVLGVGGVAIARLRHRRG